MAKEAIEAIKFAEKNADDIEKKAREDSLEIIKKAKSEAFNIISSKEKEANVKAELRINFSKNEAKEYLKKDLEKANKDATLLEKNVLKKFDEAKDLILKEIIGL